ncbi:ACT domain-containing protein [Grimontia kaedaensis]|uniref:ACT domain-containing protein n=1 Tax=Grimontia kaedaensis TaxID=2872157 RepID=A0ABY4X2T6_9GAMM|nr:ACT domain-containing protein [Grimontia kaedaensis]USH05589.1 ACT domain-containing protein [Grimontia kaedaensis]
MAGIVELEALLSSMEPALIDGEFVFCTVSGVLSDYVELEPLATFREAEGLTLLLEKSAAESANIAFESVYRQITLTVHSSLDAVGLTAAVSTKLAEKGISANVLAAYYHDHIFVQAEKAEAALKALQEFSG